MTLVWEAHNAHDFQMKFYLTEGQAVTLRKTLGLSPG